MSGPRANALGQPIGPPLTGWKQPARPPRTVMEGRYVRIEPVHERFAAELHDANVQDADGRMWTYLPYGPFDSEPAYHAWMSTTCFGADPMFHVIVDRESDRAVGVAAYMRIAPESGCIEVGHVCYSPRLQRGRGATEAMYLMMRRAFGLGYRRYEWRSVVPRPAAPPATECDLSVLRTSRATLFKAADQSLTTRHDGDAARW